MLIDLNDVFTHASDSGRANIDLVPLVTGSPTARVLAQVWGGRPCSIVSSPPGAGKSTLITHVAQHLAIRTDMRVTVATPTRRQALDIAHRMADLLPDGAVELSVTGLAPRDDRVAAKGDGDPGKVRVHVRTVASCKQSPPECDVLIVDEAYQVTAADALAAAASSRQMLLVGDSGQIDPVVSTDTTPWEGMRQAPYLPAPTVMAQRDYAFGVSLPETYRLGERTVDAIAPLYDFSFTSARADRYVSTDHVWDEIECVSMPRPDGAADAAVMSAVVNRVEDMLRATLHDEHGERRVGPSDIAVVVSHNVQATAIAVLLSDRLGATKAAAVSVGTANSLQGGEWPCVIALDPLCGVGPESEHATDAGRLCVMVSRHQAHLTWMCDEGWIDDVNDPESGYDEEGAVLARTVRASLTRVPARECSTRGRSQAVKSTTRGAIDTEGDMFP